MSTQPLKLVADIGGTNARFALYDAKSGELNAPQTLATANYPSLEQAICAYLSQTQTQIDEAAIAIATPVLGDTIKMTNHHWQFSISALKKTLNLKHLQVINDFVAQALAILDLKDHEILPLVNTTAQADAHAPKAVIGPGTGLGVSALISHHGDWQALASEGGHTSFAPRNELEYQILRYAQTLHGDHISAERLISGAGLALIDSALAHLEQKTRKRTPQEITSNLPTDSTARQTVDLFCQILASVASDLVLTLGARGGVYLCGGILPKIQTYLQTHNPLQTRFNDKGRFSDYLANVPVYLVTAQEPGLRGAMVILKQHS